MIIWFPKPSHKNQKNQTNQKNEYLIPKAAPARIKRFKRVNHWTIWFPKPPHKNQKNQKNRIFDYLIPEAIPQESKESNIRKNQNTKPVSPKHETGFVFWRDWFRVLILSNIWFFWFLWDGFGNQIIKYSILLILLILVGWFRESNSPMVDSFESFDSCGGGFGNQILVLLIRLILLILVGWLRESNNHIFDYFDSFDSCGVASGIK